MKRAKGLCTERWWSFSYGHVHFCWHPAGHPGCHNCEVCGESCYEAPAPIPTTEHPPAPAPPPRKRIRPKIDNGPCKYMFFTLPDYNGNHDHKCRRPNGHSGKHECYRCGLRVGSLPRQSEKVTETRRTWEQQRRYLKTTSISKAVDAEIRPQVLKGFLARNAQNRGGFEFLPYVPPIPMTLDRAKRYIEFAEQRRRQGAIASLLFNLDILVLN